MRVVRSFAVGLVATAFAACATHPHAQDAATIERDGWTDENGAPFALERFRGTPIVLAPFFTSCTARCPLTVSKLREVDDAFRASSRPVVIVLFTLDPRSDDTDRLSRFKRAEKMPDHWHLSRASDEDTRALARHLGIDPAYDTGHVDHEVRIGVFDDRGRLARIFSGWSFDPNATVEAIVR